MNLQQSTLHQYRIHYPQHTLKEIAAKTQINLTRVFRLFNGSDMRVAELEAFNDAISNNGQQFLSHDHFLNLAKDFSMLSSNGPRKEIYLQMKHMLKNKLFLEPPINSGNQYLVHTM